MAALLRYFFIDTPSHFSLHTYTHGAFDALSGVTLAAVSRILLFGCLLVTRAYKSESSTLYPHYVQLRTEIDSSSLGRRVGHT